MITDSNNKELKLLLDNDLAISSINNKVFLYAYYENKSCVINKITSSGGDSCYPDIFYNHSLSEISICDDLLYIKACDSIHRFGSDFCIFISVKEGELERFTPLFESVKCITDNKIYNFPDIISLSKKLSDDLSLSATMRTQFVHVLGYYISAGGCYEDLEKEIYKNYKLPATKIEGKRIYNEIKSTIIC